MDLDDELFAATAGAKPSSKKRKSSKSTKGSNSKRRRELSESDESEPEAELSEEEVSEGDDVEEDDDEDALLRGKKDSSKGGSSMPLKKRVALQDDDSDEDDEDLFERELYKELGFGKDLYKDEEDKNELAQMTEFYREYELAERAEKRDALIEQHQLRERNRQQEAAFVESNQTPKARQSAGPKRTQPQRRQEREKDSELKELKAIREKKGLHKPRPTARPSRDDEEEGSSGDEYQEEDAKPSDNEEDFHEEEEEEDDDYEMVHRQGRGQETPEAYSDDGEDMDDHDEEKFAEQSDLKHVILSRVTLEKWHKELFFANTVVGCFVKVSIGVKDGRPLYALGEVVDIIDEYDGKKLNPYEFPLGSKKQTSKWLLLVCGTKKAFSMDMVSNKEMTEQDFLTMQKYINQHRLAPPTKGQVERVRKKIRDAEDFRYTSEAVSQIVAQRKASGKAPVNLTVEKDRLMQQLEIAREEGNEDEVGDVEAQLMEVEEKLLNSNEALARIARLNKNNAHQNLVEAGGKKTDKKSKDKMQESKVDPFSRRATSFSCYWTPRTTQEDTKAKAKEEAAPAAPPVDVSTEAGTKADEEPPTPRVVVPKEKAAVEAHKSLMLDIDLSRVKDTAAREGSLSVAARCRLHAVATPFSSMPDTIRRLSLLEYKRRQGIDG